MTELMISSAAEALPLAQARRRIFLALFTALAVALHTFEFLLPSPAPWFRLGMANILTLVALFRFDGRAAWTLTLTRVGIGSLVLGQLLSPGFFLSLAGGVSATALMTLSRRLWPEQLGPIGVSALGAAGHALGQMTLAWLLLVRHPGLWNLFPYLLLAALLTGICNGLAADLLLGMLRQHRAFASHDSDGSEPEA
jgi:heptaprenyl diphosphate synthase